MLTSATDKQMRSSKKSVNLNYRCDILGTTGIYTTNAVSIKWAAMSERGLV